jgi:cystine transport system permease protein
MEKLAYYYFNFDIMAAAMPQMLQGLAVTMLLALTVIIIGVSSGLLLAVLRLYPTRWLRWPIIAFVDIFRSLPQLVVIVVIYFALPYAGITFPPFWSTVMGLSLVLAAFAQESFWASITATKRGQWEAAQATGLSHTATIVYVVLPPAIRAAIPSLTNRTIAITKGTALGSAIAVQELLAHAQSIQSVVANPSPLTLGAILYLIIFAPMVLFSRWLEAKYRWGE